jgi:hypothetical protein
MGTGKLGRLRGVSQYEEDFKLLYCFILLGYLDEFDVRIEGSDGKNTLKVFYVGFLAST